MTRKIIIPLILLAATTAHADSLLDQGMSLVEQGQAFLRGNDGVTLRKAWGRRAEQELGESSGMV